MLGIRLLIFLIFASGVLAPQSGFAFGHTVGGTNGTTTGLPTPGGRDEVVRRSDVVLLRGGRAEYIAIGPTSQSAAAANALTSRGAILLRQRNLNAFGSRALLFDLRGVSLAEARAILAQSARNTRIDLHHLYRFSNAKPRLFAASMIGVANPGGCRASGLRIGMIDGAVNTSHPALRNVRITTASALLGSKKKVKTGHGTAVAALLVGEDPSGFLNGYSQGAHLFSASAFTAERQGDATTVERIATALNWMVSNGVRLVNMSFAGPTNTTLEGLMQASSRRGMVLVAAAGNKGKSNVAYPAASPHVIAVTAVDAAARRYRKANRGPGVEFAAPGVDIYVAKGKGGSYATGTSFAAPIVSAIAAQAMLRGARSTNAVRSALRRQSKDLGASGRDREYGWGLVTTAGGC